MVAGGTSVVPGGHVCGGKGHVFPLADLPPGPVDEGQSVGSMPVGHADEWEHVKAVVSDVPSMEEVSGEAFE